MKTIKLYYYNKINNFGDLLNTYIIPKMFDCNIQQAKIEDAEALFIGSILNAAWTKNPPTKNENLDVWGSGFIRDTEPEGFLCKSLNVFAVRGELTKKMLEKIANKKFNFTLGDPGLLCSKVYPDTGIEKTYDWGIIPHYVDQNNENLKKLKLPNSIYLDIHEKPETFIPKLLKCKKIISSAMHGLIVSDSYNIPNIRMIVNDKIVGGDFKYNDYYSVFGIDNHNKIDLRKIKDPIYDLDIDYKITPEQVQKIQNNLIRSFPYI